LGPAKRPQWFPKGVNAASRPTTEPGRWAFDCPKERPALIHPQTPLSGPTRHPIDVSPLTGSSVVAKATVAWLAMGSSRNGHGFQGGVPYVPPGCASGAPSPYQAPSLRPEIRDSLPGPTRKHALPWRPDASPLRRNGSEAIESGSGVSGLILGQRGDCHSTQRLATVCVSVSSRHD
jgi:hypothetical protein